MTISVFVLRLVIALLAGLIIGVERQWNHKETGLKTNILVTTGSAIFVLLSIKIVASDPSIDISRIVGQVVTGVGFLGAGVIFREGANVHGLTSAATIWCSAAIGCTAATGYILETIICTLLVVIVNLSMDPLEAWLKKRK